MDDIVSSPVSPQNRKRPAAGDTSSPAKKPLNLKGTQFVMPTPPDTDQSSNASPENDGTRAASPAPSSSALSSIQEVESNADTTTHTNADGTSSTAKPTSTGQPPAKRRKLTPSEKIEQQRAKEARAAEKAEQKARKDEEKRAKDEEKRLKAEEREAKRREKDLEEERKNQEKLKKERSQMRLGAFFQKPATPAKATGASNDLDDSAIRARRRSLSLETYDDIADQIRRSASPATKGGRGTPKATQLAKVSQTPLQQAPSKPVQSDYRKHFLPFDLQSHTILAPLPYAHRASDEYDKAQAVFDADLNDPTLQEKYDLGLVSSYANIESIFPPGQHVRGNLDLPTTRQIVEQIHGSSSQQPIDLTREASTQNPVDLLQTLPLRYLHFAEDVRPPYFGTYTRIRSGKSSRHLSRNPFARERDDTNYDYDSEAEWEEPEEGEDLLNDEDDEVESNGDPDEMDEFLDDEHDEMRNKRKMITGDLLPVSTGLCWEDEKRKVVLSTEHDEGASDLSDMRMDFLIPGFTGKTIDPFSTAYWEPTIMAPPGIPVRDTFGLSQQPARQPLKEKLNSNSATPELVGAAEGQKGPINSVAAIQGEKRGRKPAPRVLSKEDMDEFKDAVVGSALKKADLQKGLKSR